MTAGSVMLSFWVVVVLFEAVKELVLQLYNYYSSICSVGSNAAPPIHQFLG